MGDVQYKSGSPNDLLPSPRSFQDCANKLLLQDAGFSYCENDSHLVGTFGSELQFYDICRHDDFSPGVKINGTRSLVR